MESKWKFRTWNLNETKMDDQGNEAEKFLIELESEGYERIEIRQADGYLTIFAQPEEIEIVCDQCGELDDDCTCEDNE